MYRKRTHTIAIVGTLLLGSFGALAMLPADPATIARATSIAPAQSETLASIDALLGPPATAEAPVDAAITPIDRSALAQPANATRPDPNLQTAALTQPVAEPAPIVPNDAIGASAVNLRAGPSSAAATLSVLQPGQPIQISGKQDGWIEVTLPDGSTGWVYARYLASAPAPEPEERTTVAAADTDAELKGRTARIETSLAVRSNPSAGARTVFRTEPGERVRIIGVDGNWLHIRTVDGNLGWIQYTT